MYNTDKPLLLASEVINLGSESEAKIITQYLYKEAQIQKRLFNKSNQFHIKATAKLKYDHIMLSLLAIGVFYPSLLKLDTIIFLLVRSNQ